MYSPVRAPTALEAGSMKQNASFLTTTSSLSGETPGHAGGPGPSCFEVAAALKKRSCGDFAGGGRKPNRRPRRESSLKQICTSILRRFLSGGRPEIRLNKFASELKVERRRIYDIVNVLEGFDIVSKRGKNLYLWCGLEGFSEALRRLQAAEKARVPGLRVFSFEAKDPRAKKKSLTFLSIKLLKLFVIYRENINFKELIKLFGQKYLELKLNSDDKELKRPENKNKIRRLYDIVNVFKSLGLIEKVVNSSGKSVFEFKGVEGLLSNVAQLQTPGTSGLQEDSSSLVRVVVFNQLGDGPRSDPKKQNKRKTRGGQPRKNPGGLDLKRIKQSSYFENIALNPRPASKTVSGPNPPKPTFPGNFLPAPLANLAIVKNSENFSILTTKKFGQAIHPNPRVPLLRCDSLSPKLKQEISLFSRKSSRSFFGECNGATWPNENSEKNRFFNLKKKFLTSKLESLKGRLVKIQNNYFEEEHESFFSVLYNCMDNLHRYV